MVRAWPDSIIFVQHWYTRVSNFPHNPRTRDAGACCAKRAPIFSLSFMSLLVTPTFIAVTCFSMRQTGDIQKKEQLSFPNSMTLPFWYTLLKNFLLVQLQKRTLILMLPDFQIVGISTINARIRSCSVHFVQHSIFVTAEQLMSIKWLVYTN
jgi:hypothetical protein